MDEKNLNTQANKDMVQIQKDHRIFFIIAILFLLVLVSFGYWFFKNNINRSNVDRQNVNQSQVIENNGVAVEYVIPNLKYLSESDEEGITMIIQCNYINDRDYLKYFPITLQNKWSEDLREIDEDKREEMKEKGITEEEAYADFKKCLTYFSEEKLALADYLVKTDTDKDGVNLYLEYLQKSDDNKSDTDGDGFDDLTEFESGNDLNSNFKEENLASWHKVAEALSAPDIDLDRVKDLCMDLDRGIRDNCLKVLYWYAEDEMFCAELKYYNDNDSDGKEELCRSIVRGRKAYLPGQAAKCLELNDTYEQSVCLAQDAISQHSLESCKLGSNFSECASVKGVFNALADSQKCIEHAKDFSSISNFDTCIYSTAVLDGNIDSCYYLQMGTPFQCILKVLGADKDVCEKYQGTWDESQFIDELRCESTNQELFKAYIGVYDENMTAAMAKQKGMVFVGGSLVIDVVEWAPAEQAGIKKDDVITEINGIKLNANNDLRKVLSRYTNNDEIELKIWSEGAYKKLKIKFSNVHDAYYNLYGDLIYDYDYPYWNL